MKEDIEKEKRLKTGKDDEIKAVLALTSFGPATAVYSDVTHVQNEEIDKKFHVDIMAHRLGEGIRLIDVKSIQPKHYDTGNYSIGSICVDCVKNERNPIYDFMFRLAEDSVLIDKFLIVDAKQVVERCHMRLNEFDGKTPYYLVSINEIREKCDVFEVYPDIPGL